MVLDSQRNMRGGSGAFISSGKRARQRRALIITAAGFAVVALVSWFWLSDAEPADQQGQPAADTIVINGQTPQSDRQAVRLNDVVTAGIGPISQDRRPESTDRTEVSTAVTSNAATPGTSQAEVSLDNRTVAQLTDSRSVAANITPSARGGGSQTAVIEARSLQSQNKIIEAREVLNDALRTSTSPAEREAARAELAIPNERMVFSREVVPNDPFTEWYTIKSGDLLSKIAKQYQVTDDFLAHINRIPNKNAIRAGDRIKVVKGPFHAQVDKSDFRLDLYLGDAPGAGLYVRSFRVGLGADNGTPLGSFQVRNKLKNPEWVNPRTGEKVYADDPENPIGERWIGLQGIDDNTASLRGYGIHGTIEPQTIGTEASMGCIRMHAGDVELVYSMMIHNISRVKIDP